MPRKPPLYTQHQHPRRNSLRDEADSEEELPKEHRLKLAQAHYRSATNNDSLRKIARQYCVPSSTLNDRINGKLPHTETGKIRQRLTEGEEKALCDYIERLEAWGWPITIGQLL